MPRREASGPDCYSLGTPRTLAVKGTPSASAAPLAAAKEAEDGPVLQIGDDIALADTQYGRVCGYVLRGIHHFLGIPYGADTLGPNRFMPPRPPKAWTDVRPALWWGNTAPQNMDNRYANPYGSFRDHWNYDDVSEDCLKLNVFTPALADGKKRPVLFWIHGGGFNPVVDGVILPQDPYTPGPAPTAAAIPMLICSTVEEQSPSWADASLESITLEQVVERVKVRAGFGAGFGDRAQGVVDAYVKAFPGKKPVEIWCLVTSNRQNTVALAEAKSKQPPPVYVAWFGWQPPLFDRRMRAFHCVDICFWFDDTDLMLTHTVGGARPRKLAAKMARSLLQFMRTGDPNGGGLPAWPRFTAAKRETMVLDDVSVVKNDPDGEARRALPAL